jgi:hypothetical protein
MTHASRRHARMDTALAERLARDGESGHGGALLPSRSRLKDLRSMNTPNNRRVLLTTLSCRTSAKGHEYLSGFLAKAKVVAFEGEPDKYGNETWNIYLSEPEPRPVAPVERPSAEIARGGVDADWDSAF